MCDHCLMAMAILRCDGNLANQPGPGAFICIHQGAYGCIVRMQICTRIRTGGSVMVANVR